MKKPLRRLLALLAAGLLALLPTGCDGTTRSDTLQFTSFLTGEPVTARGGPPFPEGMRALSLPHPPNIPAP